MGNLFSGNLLETIGVSGINNLPRVSYDDVSLLSTFAGELDEGLVDINLGANGERCGIPHQCWNGQVGTECHPFGGGCRKGTCPDNAASDTFLSFGLTYEKIFYEDNLNNSLLYTFRNQLSVSQEGEYYIKGLNVVGDHFKESLNVEILTKLSLVSVELKDFVTAYNDNNSNYVLTENVYNQIIEIAQSSADNSTSYLYGKAINMLKNRTLVFKNKTVGEIKSILN